MRKRKGFSFVTTDNISLGKLYQTLIYKKMGSIITLNSGGWRTNHTKNCINDLLPRGYYIFQRKFKWFLKTPIDEIEFLDNMRIKCE